MNTAIISQFLGQFSRMLAPDVQATIIQDRAVKASANVTLIPLPPHSSKFNGFENHLHHLRSHCWSNWSYENLDDLTQV